MKSFLLEKFVTNPAWVFRKEFDDWAILFEPDTGNSFTLNAMATYIWEHLDGKLTVEKILNLLKAECEDKLPSKAPEEIKAFLLGLKKEGLIGYK